MESFIELLNGVAKNYPLAAILISEIAFIATVWYLERKDKLRIIEEYDHPDHGKLRKQQAIFDKHITDLNMALDIERKRTDEVSQQRIKDAEKMIAALGEINTALAVLTEKIRGNK